MVFRPNEPDIEINQVDIPKSIAQKATFIQQSAPYDREAPKPSHPNQATKPTVPSPPSTLSISKSSTIETVDEATKYRPITDSSKALRAST
jgi:hypothetical protein